MIRVAVNVTHFIFELLLTPRMLLLTTTNSSSRVNLISLMIFYIGSFTSILISTSNLVSESLSDAIFALFGFLICTDYGVMFFHLFLLYT